MQGPGLASASSFRRGGAGARDLRPSGGARASGTAPRRGGWASPGPPAQALVRCSGAAAGRRGRRRRRRRWARRWKRAVPSGDASGGRCARGPVAGADPSGGGGEDGGGEPLRFPGSPHRRPRPGRPGRALPPVQLGAAARRGARQVGSAERGGHLLPDHSADALQGPQVLPLPPLPGRPRPGLGQGERGARPAPLRSAGPPPRAGPARRTAPRRGSVAAGASVPRGGRRCWGSCVLCRLPAGRAAGILAGGKAE